MILNKIYLSDDHYIIVYNEKFYLKVFLDNDKIVMSDIISINKNIIRELSEAFVLYQFPFSIKWENCSHVEFNFHYYLNSKIIFYIDKNKLICQIMIDNNIVKEFWIKNRHKNILKLYLTNVHDVELLTYIEDIQIYSYQDKGYPYVMIYLTEEKLNSINKLAKKYNWIISKNI